MRSLSASELLETWERCLTQSLVHRALELLSVVYPQAPRDHLLALRIGQRDAVLLGLREQLFGSEMAAVTVCPKCGGQLDLTLNAAEMLSAWAPQPEAEVGLSLAGYDLQFRNPNSEDLAVALAWNCSDEARDRLLDRCARLAGDPYRARDRPAHRGGSAPVAVEPPHEAVVASFGMARRAGDEPSRLRVEDVVPGIRAREARERDGARCLRLRVRCKA